MAWALVGTIGTVSVGTAGNAVSPSFGTGETRTAGNLLVCFVDVTEVATLPTTPSGWSVAAQRAQGTTSSTTIFYKTALGSDAAPTIAAITSGIISAQLAEFSGVIAGSTNQTGVNGGTASPVTATNGGASAATSQLILIASVARFSNARAPNLTLTSNHVTSVTQAGNNNAASSTNHYSFGYGTTNSISGADTTTVTLSVTTNLTTVAIVDAVFLLGNTRVSSFTVDAFIQVTRTHDQGSYSSAILADGPAAYYRLDSVSTFLDSSGNGHDGAWSINTPVIANTLLANPLDAADKAISFVNLPLASVTDSSWWANGDGSGNASIEAWGDFAATGAGQHNFMGALRPASDAANAMYMSQLNASANIEYRWRNSAGTAFTGSYALPGAGLYHLVLVKSGSNLILYSNGVQVSTVGSLTGSISSSGLATVIGRAPDAANNFQRTMDEVSLWAKALTANQVAAHYAAGLGTSTGIPLDAVIVLATRFTLDAVIQLHQGSFTLDAILKSPQLFGSDSQTIIGGDDFNTSNGWFYTHPTYATLTAGPYAAPTWGFGGSGDIGQHFVVASSRYWVDEAFVSWPRLGLRLAPGAVVDSSTLRVKFTSTSNIVQDFVIEARLYDWVPISAGAGNFPAWLFSSSISGQTLAATLDTTLVTADGFYDFTDVALTSNLANGYVLAMSLTSSRYRTQNAPISGTDEYVTVKLGGGGVATNDKIRLLVNYHANAGITLDAWKAGTFLLDAVITSGLAFTLNACLKVTVAGTFLLDAVVLRTQSGSFLLDAVVLRTQSAAYTLDALVLRTQAAAFTLDASVAAAGAGAFTLDAVLKATSTGSFTLDAILKATVTGAFALDAWLIKTVASSFTLDAVKAGAFTLDAKIVGGGSFTLDAIRLVTVDSADQTFSDDFNRSVGPGTGSLGGPWVWSEDDSRASVAEDDNVYVDGSAVILPPHPDGDPFGFNYSSWRWGPRPSSGTLLFDFWVPSLLGQSNSHPTYGVNLDSDTNPVFIYVWPDSSGNWLVGTSQWDESSNVPDASFTPDASTWYRAELLFDADQNVEMRVWKVGDSRPSSPLTSGQMDDVGAPSNEGFPFLDLYFSAGNEEDARLDNFSLTGPFPIGFTLDAEIADLPTFPFNLDAILKVTVATQPFSYSTFVLADGPAAYYRMASASTFLDSSGNGHDGSWSLATPVLAASLLSNPHDSADRAISFVNSPEASVTDSSWWANGDVDGNATIEAWVDLLAPNTAGVHQFIGALRPASDAANAFYMLQLNGSSSIEFRWRNSSGTAYTGTYPIPSAGVYHLVLVKEGAVITLWVNGFAQASSGGLTGSINSVGLPTEIGRMADSGVRFTRTMDEVALYARALTEQEIVSHYRAGRGFSVGLVLDAFIPPNFSIDAFIVLGTQFYLNAAIVVRPSELFVLSALIARNSITLDAVIGPGGIIHLDALVNAHQSGSLTLDSWIRSTTRPFSKTIDAAIGLRTTSSFEVRANLERVITTVSSSASVDAVCDASSSSSLTLDAVVSNGVQTGSFTLNADTRGTAEKRGLFTLNAAFRQGGGDLFSVEAQIAGNGFFQVQAWMSAPFLLDAYVIANTPSSSFTTNATVKRNQTGTFTLSADKKGANEQRFTFTLDAVIPARGIVGEPPIWLDAVIGTAGSQGFTLDAWIPGSAMAFTISAFIRTTFTVDAYIKGNATIVYPDDGGPPLDPDGNPWPDWFKASRKYRIRITLNGTDVTGDVNFARTTFTQNAKTGPGTFEMVMYGVQPWLGGEVLHVEIDDLRAFGGFVMSVERTYVFEADASTTATILRGTDFNVLFDRLFAYNKASATGTRGNYTNWRAFAQGTYDDTIIRKVFGSYTDLPAGFDYTSYVDRVGVAAIEEAWTLPTAGTSLRQTMQSLSQVTTSVWWIDPYLNLHNHARTTITAPYPITDGLGGISSRELSVSADITNMVNEAMVWGTLARNVEGEINARHVTTSSSLAAYGRWQYGEFRSDLHHQSYINRRAASILDRYDEPIYRAKMVIFEPGYQAGQGVQIISSSHGVSTVLVIRSMTLSFAVAKERSGNTYYGVPRYELQVGLDPESPWDIYDYLPFGDADTPAHQPWQRGEDRHTDECDEPLGCDGVCGGVTDGFGRTGATTLRSISGSQTGQYISTADAGFTWDVTLTEHASVGLNGNEVVMTTFQDISPTLSRVTIASPTGTSGPGAATTPDPRAIHRFRFTLDYLGLQAINEVDGEVASLDYIDIQFNLFNTLTQPFIRVVAGGDDLIGPGGISYATLISSGQVIPGTFWTAGVEYEFQVFWDDGGGDYYPDASMIAKVIGPSGSYFTGLGQYPTGWSGTSSQGPGGGGFGISITRSVLGPYEDTNAWPVRVTYLDLPEVVDCSLVAFESFSRVSATLDGTNPQPGYVPDSGTPGWSIVTATSPADFSPRPNSTLSNASVNGSMMVMYAEKTVPGLGNPGQINYRLAAHGPWNQVNSTLTTRLKLNDGLPTSITIEVKKNDNTSAAYVVLQPSDNTVFGTDTTPVPFTFDEGQWYFLKWELSLAGSLIDNGADRFKLWSERDPEPTDWTYQSASTDMASTDNLEFWVGIAQRANVERDEVWFDSFDWDYLDRPCGISQADEPIPPTEPSAACLDDEGESFGAVTEGWGCETTYLEGGVLTTTGLVTASTLRLYDADTGLFIEPAEYTDHGDGKTFTVTSGATRVIACYRNYAVTAQHQVTPRIVSPNAPRGARLIPL